MIHWELYTRLKFGRADKYYAQKSESVLKNETLKILWDFKMFTDHQIPIRRSDVVFIN